MLSSARNGLMTGPAAQVRATRAPTCQGHCSATATSRPLRQRRPPAQHRAPGLRTPSHGSPVNHDLQALAGQRWGDHRYHHHSRIKRSLHLVSALAFLAASGLLCIDPPMAALPAWVVPMTTRQAGHAHKEAIKVSYKLRRKAVLMALWAASC